MEDDGNESPAPPFKSLPPPDALGGGRSPFKDAREKNVYTQYEAPAYSLERVFTEKELAHATQLAQMATWRYFHQPPSQQEQASNSNGTAVPSVDGELLDTGEGDETIAATTEGTPPPGQPAEMERSTSHQVLTRGGARANPLAALQDLANVAASESRAAPMLGMTMTKDPFAPVVPTYHAVTRAEKQGAPAPSGVSHLDIDNDFAMMRQSASKYAAAADGELLPTDGAMDDVDENIDEESAGALRKQLLDLALSTGPGGGGVVSQPFRLPLLETGPALIGRGVERIPGTGFAPIMSLEQRTSLMRQGGGGSAMAAALQGRLGGVGGGGGVFGGEDMSRTTSAGGGGSDIGGGGEGIGSAGRSGERGEEGEGKADGLKVAPLDDGGH